MNTLGVGLLLYPVGTTPYLSLFHNEAVQEQGNFVTTLLTDQN